MKPTDLEKISVPLLLDISSQLPASPRIFARLAKLIESEDTALDYIASLVKMDPGLAAQILRVTNSAYYGASVKISDIESAISRIGFREVQKVLSMVVTHDCFYQALPAYGMTASEFSDSSINVAVASEIIAKRIGMDLNISYISGLLHAIGKLAINLYLEKVNQVIDMSEAKGSQELVDFERETLGVSHWRAGYELLRHWQFESKIWTPIKNQFSPIDSSGFVKTTAVLTLARWIVEQDHGYDFESPMSPTLDWALGALSIDALDINMLIDDTRFEINDRQNLFSMLL